MMEGNNIVSDCFEDLFPHCSNQSSAGNNYLTAKFN